ncbi:MAG: exosortase A [Nitrospirales bacterium]|nr:MAG: exosortase A [Nitrospirales bacterium]
MAAAWVVVVFLFWDTATSMVHVWSNSDTFAHGFVILPISLYLMWARRHRITAVRPSPNLWGLLLLVGLSVGWFLGELMNVRVVQQFAVVGMLPGLVWTVLGTGVLRALIFPLAFLVFAVPMGDELVSPLQDFTAYFTVTALQLSGIPVFWEGRFFTIPTGTWHVAEACAGVRYVIPSVTLGFLFAGAVYQSWFRRCTFVLVSFFVPILANGFRAFGSVLLAHLTNNTFGKGVEHFISGWLGFGVVMFVVFWLGLKWRDTADAASGKRGHSAPPSAEAGTAEEKTRRGSVPSLTRLGPMAIGGVLLLALAPLSVKALSHQPVVSVALNPTAPSVLLPWEAVAQYVGNWVPQFRGADAELTHSYRHDAQQVHLYLAYYANSRQGAELISRMNLLVDGERWALLTERDREVVVDGRSLHVHESHIRAAQRTRVVWSWYWVAGEFTSNPYVAKLLQAKARLFGEAYGSGSAVMALGTDYDGQPDDAINILQDFLQHTSLDTHLISYSK